MHVLVSDSFVPKILYIKSLVACVRPFVCLSPETQVLRAKCSNTSLCKNTAAATEEESREEQSEEAVLHTRVLGFKQSLVLLLLSSVRLSVTTRRREK
jgi:hypothetical protein